MSLFTESKVRARANREVTNFSKSARIVLAEHIQKQAGEAGHDIFLSHAFDDRDLLSGTVLLIEDLGYSVFLDWRDDPTLDRKRVTPATAGKLRERMKASRCLLYAITPAEKDSAWMKWELGYKDGENGRTAILPIAGSETEIFNEQEFLGLYPYMSEGLEKSSKKNRLWVNRTPSCYVMFDNWLNGESPAEHP